MKKIIIKVKLKNRDDFESRLSDLGYDFDPMYWQHSRVFVPRNYQKHDNYPRMILRIEMKAVNRPAKYELICKRHIEDSGVTIVHTTQVKDYTEMASILLQLGFVIQSEVPRRRQELEEKSGIKIYLDKVDTLPGFYAKFELEITEERKVEDARRQLEAFVIDLGISDNAIILDTYAEM